MRAFWSIIIVSLLIGLGGAWTLREAVSQYTGTLRTYTQIDVQYVPDSFVWLDPEYDRARALVRATNDSPVDATIRTLRLHLRFDGRFAGANYGRFESFDVPAGESRQIEVEIDVSAPSIQAEGGTANLSYDGSIGVQFAGIERALSLDIGGTIDNVSRVEPEG